VLPSVIETEMLDAVAPDAAARSRVDGPVSIGRFGRPEEVAQVVRFPGGGGAPLPGRASSSACVASPLTGHGGARLAMSPSMGLASLSRIDCRRARWRRSVWLRPRSCQRFLTGILPAGDRATSNRTPVAASGYPSTCLSVADGADFSPPPDRPGFACRDGRPV
jgi:hypothetical protein